MCVCVCVCVRWHGQHHFPFIHFVRYSGVLVLLLHLRTLYIVHCCAITKTIDWRWDENDCSQTLYNDSKRRNWHGWTVFSVKKEQKVKHWAHKMYRIDGMGIRSVANNNKLFDITTPNATIAGVWKLY